MERPIRQLVGGTRCTEIARSQPTVHVYSPENSSLNRIFAAGFIAPELGKLAALTWLSLDNNQHESRVYHRRDSHAGLRKIGRERAVKSCVAHHTAGFHEGGAASVLKGAPAPMGWGLQADGRNGVAKRDKKNNPCLLEYRSRLLCWRDKIYGGYR